MFFMRIFDIDWFEEEAAKDEPLWKNHADMAKGRPCYRPITLAEPPTVKMLEGMFLSATPTAVCLIADSNNRPFQVFLFANGEKWFTRNLPNEDLEFFLVKENHLRVGTMGEYHEFQRTVDEIIKRTIVH